ADLFSFAGKFGAGGNPDTKGPVGWHQGQIIHWDNHTGENAIRVLGTTIYNLPLLSVTDSIMLTEGDTVGILRFKSTYFLLGRIIPPGGHVRSPTRFDTSSASGFAVPD